MLEFIIHKDRKTTIKKGGQHNPKVHTNTYLKIAPSHFSLYITLFLFDLSIRVFLANTTPVYYTFFSSFLAGFDQRYDPPRDHPSSETRSSTWWFFPYQLTCIDLRLNTSLSFPHTLPLIPLHTTIYIIIFPARSPEKLLRNLCVFPSFI